MPYNKLAQNVFGTMGTICWSGQVIPQIWKTWRTKSTKGLSGALLLLWGLAAFPLGTYAIVQNINVPLIVQPQLFCALCLISWSQCQFYGRGWSQGACVAVYVAILAVVGGLEVGMVYAIRPSYERGNDAPVLVFGIIASIMISAGLLPQYYEIYKYKEVIGISIPFMLIDLLGGVFNDLSLVFKKDFDVVAGVCYSVVVVMDAIVIIAALVLNPRAERRRKQAAALIASEVPVASTAGDVTPRNDALVADPEKATGRHSQEPGIVV